MLRLLRALHAFCRALLESECLHARLPNVSGSGVKSPVYCPDCGYPVRLWWALCRCRTCGSKRPARRDTDGRIRARHRYCVHCGQAGYRLIRKERIQLHEMPYAVLTRDIDDRENEPALDKRAANPFADGLAAGTQLDVVEGVVIRSR